MLYIPEVLDALSKKIRKALPGYARRRQEVKGDEQAERATRMIWRNWLTQQYALSDPFYGTPVTAAMQADVARRVGALPRPPGMGFIEGLKPVPWIYVPTERKPTHDCLYCNGTIKSKLKIPGGHK